MWKVFVKDNLTDSAYTVTYYVDVVSVKPDVLSSLTIFAGEHFY